MTQWKKIYDLGEAGRFPPRYVAKLFTLATTVHHGERLRGHLVSNLQAFLLGVMMAWSPTLIVLGCLLWHAPYERGSSSL